MARLAQPARALVAPGRRGVALAILVALGLRLAWVLWVTVEPSVPESDTAQFLTMAQQFADGDTYRLHDHLSALYPPGYSFLLAPLAWLAEATGWYRLSSAAALLNVVAGTASVVFAASLAGRWFGPRERLVAAWVLALAPGHIFLTSAALSETVFTAIVLGALVLVTRLVQGTGPPSTRLLVGLGAAVGYATLVRSPGAIVLVVAAVALRRHDGSWRAARQSLLPLLLATVVVLAPWTLRNGLQVGVWTPTATSNAAFLCLGHHDDAQLDTTKLTQAENEACFTGTPFAPDPDEAAWYGRTVREALGWAVTHPAEEVRLTVEKTIRLFGDDRQALSDGQDFGAQETVGADLELQLQRLGDLWHWGVLSLGLAAFALLPRARAAWPLWVTAAGLVVAVWGGVPLDRFHHTVMAILVVPASATLVAMGRWAESGVGMATPSPDDDTIGPPPTPREGLERAAGTGSLRSGPPRHPFAPVLLAVTTGAWVCAVAFDVVSLVADTAFVYARGAWLTTGIGVASGLVTALAVLLDLLDIPRGTVAFRVGVRHLIALDVALVAFAASFLVRNGSDFLYHDASPTLAIVLSVIGLAALAVVHWLQGTLTYRYGIRVALDEERQAGFEPADR